MKLMGYPRENGTYGIRNHILIIPASVCAVEVANRIAEKIGAVSLPHQHGCCQMGDDFRQTVRTLTGFGCNPNVGAVLVVGLGCEGIQPSQIAEEIKKTGKPVEFITIQACGGTTKTIEQGLSIVSKFAETLATAQKVPFSINHLILGMECGGSDPTSGIVANPAIGIASDQLVSLGGTSILSETTEVIGAEHILAERFPDAAQRSKFLTMVSNVEKRALAVGEDLRGSQPTPGNIQGGLSTIEEKSLGCMHKAGNTAPFIGALAYGETVPTEKPGLYFMDTPGEDIDSITGMVAGGAQLVVFTTGRGTPTGCPIAPVIKITGNPETYYNMEENIDINGGKVMQGDCTLDELGEEIFRKILLVANGAQTKAEKLGHKEFGIYRIGFTF
ncbi:(2R)-sulfolactate sulfo-lyase subunit beta precursor [Anaerotignum neopropionicum]|uniref:(2R)-sulfolactate sulfo-lyase subunit beta n=1 Tax=Anaerotignum neopropionicum TaxID=36847 RepID=A0A136WFN6_9FIRM|nr:UxaA family hydrolase [Anaerotignum neopropionicum]KXL53314.1 (2R)-sulfolactate sulfo-lyase subunit beta precursor [Anaerotignum neopropionicum]